MQALKVGSLTNGRRLRFYHGDLVATHQLSLVAGAEVRDMILHRRPQRQYSTFAESCVPPYMRPFAGIPTAETWRR